jgi:diguanylate cyclase (GGDEF)-like protein
VLSLLSEVIAAHMTDAVVHVHGPRSDDLTGLGNRRHYDERLAAEVARACASGRDLSLCLFDLSSADGAQRSDAALLAVARVLECVRDSDEAFRIGPEEFAVLLPFTPLDAARSVAGRIAAQIASAGVGDGLLRACYGVADVRGPDPLTLHATAAAELTALKHVRRATVPRAA